MVAPGVIGFSASRNPRLKDTALNVQSKHGFVVNLISEPWLQQAHAGSISAPEGVSEWGFSGLTKVPSVRYHRLVSLSKDPNILTLNS